MESGTGEDPEESEGEMKASRTEKDKICAKRDAEAIERMSLFTEVT